MIPLHNKGKLRVFGDGNLLTETHLPSRREINSIVKYWESSTAYQISYHYQDYAEENLSKSALEAILA